MDATPATREDIQRIFELLAGMQQEIGGLRADMQQEISGLRADMQQEISGLRADMQQEIGGLRKEVESVELRLADRLERSVTTILTGFHVHAKRANARDTALETRVAQIEDRLLDIEKQLGLPPAA